MKQKKKRKNNNFFVEPDEIFLDSKNIQNFDVQQFEGRIEKPISKKSILLVGIFLSLFMSIFSFRLGYLQIEKGEAYLERGKNNTLEKQIIFNERGIIYDKNKVELAWNEKDKDTSDTIRSFISPGFSHVLGYISYPMQDKDGNYWQNEFIGKDGLEKEYNTLLKGKNGSKIVEIDARKKVHSENIVNPPLRGSDLITTLDSKIQKELYTAIKDLAQSSSFSGGAGILMDVRNGEILASTSFPEYDSTVLSLGKDKTKITSYLNDKRKVFLDRTISGLYTPGSIVKPFFAIGALAEKIIDPYKKILSTGSISIQNPYFPDQKTTFKDWKAHGWVDMTDALAVSSDVYFYAIGGGYEDQKGLGITNLEKYAQIFGIGQQTGIDLPDEKGGVIPNPFWKAKNFKGESWSLGNTYHTSIGQYGFQVTPMEMVRAISSIANYGTLVTPHYILGDIEKEKTNSKINL
ncbi:MAG: penicillin-binding transpeptidase domain-containing protein, partial [Patescibacteria group bacterium]